MIISYDQLRDGSNLIKTILYLPKIGFLLANYHLTNLIFLINFHNQHFESIYTIDFLN